MVRQEMVKYLESMEHPPEKVFELIRDGGMVEKLDFKNGAMLPHWDTYQAEIAHLLSCTTNRIKEMVRILHNPDALVRRNEGLEGEHNEELEGELNPAQ